MQIENSSRFRIPVCLGTGADGKELTIDLTETPNLLVAGKGPAKDALMERLIAFAAIIFWRTIKAAITKPKVIRL